MQAALPTRARVVIIGGGVVGSSVAYHLTELGWTDVVLLEQGVLSCGTTWHAAGLVGQLRATESGTRLVQYGAALYERLEAETGLGTGFRRCGGLTVARTPDRMVQLRRTAAAAAAYDLECELITGAQAKQRYPILEDSDLVGAIWLPGDGRANPTDLTYALAKGARQRGALIIERTRVIGVLTGKGAVTGVRTDAGDIEAEIVVNCAGQWAMAVAAMAATTVPLHSAEHFYVVTDQIDGVHRDLPILRDPDGYIYVKEEVGGLVIGGFEPTAKPWVSPDAIPYPFEFQLLGEDWDHFEILMNAALERIPALHTTGIKKFYNGPESFTPDNQFILGESPTMKNFFVGAGFNSVGIASAGGAGQALAEWIVAGEPTSDLTGVDIRRFAPFHANITWLKDRVGEVLGLHYAIPWPNRELTTARPFRRSPLHDVLADQGSCWGSRMGWERPNVFAPSGHAAEIDYTWGKPAWLDWSSAEQHAVRNTVAVFDQTSFSKYLVTGPGAEQALQWLCTADVAVAPGQVVYTGMLNARGTYEADITVTRLSAEEYLLVSSAAQTIKDPDYIRRFAPSGADIRVADVTSTSSVIGVMGPNARTLLSRLTRADMSDQGFGFATSRQIDIGYSTVRATRITYVGELGWELYVPTEMAVGVYHDLMAAGEDLGITPAGYYAIESLRLEKGYRAYGRELTPDTDPVQAGLLFTCAFDTNFRGREAVLAARAAGPKQRVASFVASDPDVMLWGGELLLHHGRPAGQVTSAAWGATLGAAVGLTWVRDDDGATVPLDRLEAGGFEVDVAGTRVPVTLSRRPLYDPTNQRVRV